MLMLFAPAIFSLTHMPRIVAMPTRACVIHINRWIEDTTDVSKRCELKQYRDLYLRGHSRSKNIGNIAVVSGSEVRALTMLENITQSWSEEDVRIHMWYLYASDKESGSFLMRALIDQIPTLSLSNDVDPRWHVAKKYFNSPA